MKKLQSILVIASLVLLAGCDSFLSQDPVGGMLVQSQFDELNNKLQGSMRGIYSMMYPVDNHDAFGQRSIDMYGDLLCSDMALTAESYGWFSVDEHQQTRTSRSGYMWSYYYSMLRNINMVISTVNNTTPLLEHIQQYGMPNQGLEVRDAEGNLVYHYDEIDSISAIYYAQALTMRGYVYSGLLRFYTPTVDHLFKAGYNLTNYPAFPVYTEENFNSGAQDLAMINEVYKIVDSDLTTAIDMFDAFGKEYVGSSKLEVGINVARGLLAYFYLNRAREVDVDPSDPLLEMPMRKALTYANDVIKSGAYSLIPNATVLTNGFNNLEDPSWIWGQNVTTETAGGLASWFGQCDIHSYSYAWAGDTKAIDKKLYEAIPAWDIRKQWFNDGQASPMYALCPDKKFFSAKNPTSTASDNIDREWLSDNVFMRLEAMYLIAAEACYFMNKQDSAVLFLTAITNERINTANPDAAAAYGKFKTSLSDRETFAQALIQNWRVEMWGEGYGLQTFRRLTTHAYQGYNEETDSPEFKVRRGANHVYNAGAEISYDDETTYTMYIPASETNYNPYLAD